MKLSIVYLEDNKEIFRHDKNVNNGFNREKFIYDALCRMSMKMLDTKKLGLINSEKLFNYFKIKYGLSWSDFIGIMKDTIKNDLNKWKLK